MPKTSTPSTEVMTDGQIGKLQELLGAALRKRRKQLLSEAVQGVLGQEGDALQADFLAALRKRVENRSTTISRQVSVNRNRTPQEVLDATKRAQYTDKSVVATMLSGGAGIQESVEVVFFKLGRYISNADLEREYEERGLKPDPYAQAAVNEADPAFADEHPNGTHWKDANGNQCFVAFGRFGGGRDLHVDRRVLDWGDNWWFGGVRK